jgi:hypothetical protein
LQTNQFRVKISTVEVFRLWRSGKVGSPHFSCV